MRHCKNCHKTVTDNYCSHCGQRTKVERITIGNLIKELPHTVFHIDRGILYNFIQLFKRPGKAINEYIAGKRRPFFHPVSFLVIALILNYLVVKITDLHFYDEGELLTMSELEATAIKDYDALQWWFLEHTYIYILIAIPASTLFLYGVLRLMKQTYNVAEASVVVLFTIGQGVLMQTILYFCFGWTHSGAFLRLIETINMTMLISYASYVIYKLATPVRIKISRILLSAFGGIGLASVWIASAYLLLKLLS